MIAQLADIRKHKINFSFFILSLENITNTLILLIALTIKSSARLLIFQLKIFKNSSMFSNSKVLFFATILLIIWGNNIIFAQKDTLRSIDISGFEDDIRHWKNGGGEWESNPPWTR